MQNHYNLVYREEEREMNPYCAQSGVALMPWSPLARGILAGAYQGGFAGGSTNRSTGADRQRTERVPVGQPEDQVTHAHHQGDVQARKYQGSDHVNPDVGCEV